MLRRSGLLRGLGRLNGPARSAVVGGPSLEKWKPPRLPLSSAFRSRHQHLHSSSVFLAKSKTPPKKAKGKQASAGPTRDDDDELGGEDAVKSKGPGDLMKQLQELEDQLAEELTMHFSLRVDLRQYEQLPVKLDSGEVVAMNHLARVTMKTPSLVALNFSANPAAIKAAKLALEQSSLGTPQQEGTLLHISIPRMTREKREEKVKSARKIFNDYKDALNKV